MISANLVKDLREKTGAGMMDCKKALTETNGDFEAAIDWLRAKGLAAAAKKAGRVAAEGLTAVALAGTKASAIELNSETDFVARNDIFQNCNTGRKIIIENQHSKIFRSIRKRMSRLLLRDIFYFCEFFLNF